MRLFGSRKTPGGFTLIELLVVIGTIALLAGLLLPSLRSAREAARSTRCLANQRSLGQAWLMYANSFHDKVMPLAYFRTREIGLGEQVFWWGTHGSNSTPVNHEQGFIAPFLETSPTGITPIFECPSQPWGTYTPQGFSGPTGEGSPTSTYGYNGYYLTPVQTPGWESAIGRRGWRRVSDIRTPSSLFVFADAMLPGTPMRNSALLDPPMLWFSADEGWVANTSPTTAFRHGSPRKETPGVANAANADGSARNHKPSMAWMVRSTIIGSVVREGISPNTMSPEANVAHYVPDAREWR